jgi:hypothetical protein
MKRSIMAVAIVAMLLSVVFVPMTATVTSAATADDPYEEDDYKQKLIEMGYIFVERDGIEYAVIGDTEYELAFLVGLAIGLAIGIIIGWKVLAPALNGSGNQEAVNKALRDGEAGKVIAALDSAKNLATAVLPADAELWRFTINYWQRAAEYYVAEFWDLNADLDMDSMLDGIDLYDNIAHYITDWSEGLDVAYNTYAAHPGNQWTKDHLKDMNMTISWDGGSVSGGTPITTSSYSLWSDFSQYLRSASGKNTAYIYNGPHPAGSSSQYCDMIYYFGSGTAKITNTTTNNIYTLNAGINALNSIYNESTHASGILPSGTYTFETGKQYAGPIMPSATSSAADLSGTMVFGHDSTVYFALSDKNDSKNTVSIYNNNGTIVKESSTLRWVVSYDGQNGSSTEVSAIFGDDPGNAATYDLIGDYNSLITSIEYVISEVCEDAVATWAIFDIMEEANSAISPSILRSMAEDIPMSAAEYVGAAVQMMIQIHDAYERKGDAIENGSININPESLALYVYGDVYKNGTLWAENVVFTPYINNTNQSLAVGENQWAGTGHLMVWWQGENLASWTGSASLSKYTYVAMDKNSTLKIKQITKNHVNVSSVNLTKSQIIEYIPDGDIPPLPPDPPKVGNSNLTKTLVTIIFILLAVLSYLGIGVMGENEAIGAIVALVLLAVGFLGAEVIVDIITGNFHFKMPWFW